jgi:hypothetical protein
MLDELWRRGGDAVQVGVAGCARRVEDEEPDGWLGAGSRRRVATSGRGHDEEGQWRCGSRRGRRRGLGGGAHVASYRRWRDGADAVEACCLRAASEWSRGSGQEKEMAAAGGGSSSSWFHSYRARPLGFRGGAGHLGRPCGLRNTRRSSRGPRYGRRGGDWTGRGSLRWASGYARPGGQGFVPIPRRGARPGEGPRWRHNSREGIRGVAWLLAGAGHLR